MTRQEIIELVDERVTAAVDNLRDELRKESQKRAADKYMEDHHARKGA